MADVHTKAVRSYNMSQIRSKNTKPEVVVRTYLFARGFGTGYTDKNNDTKAVKALKKEGWKIINVWECTLKPARREKTLKPEANFAMNWKCFPY